ECYREGGLLQRFETSRRNGTKWYNKLDMTMLLGKTEDELMEFAEGIGEARFRGKQIYRAIYGRGGPRGRPVTRRLKDLREKLNSIARVAETQIIEVFYSADGTRRYLLRLGDGREAEAVFMPEERRDTICLSCQVGCAVGCGFCMTAQLGVKRGMTAGGIISEVVLVFEQGFG